MQFLIDSYQVLDHIWGLLITLELIMYRMHHVVGWAVLFLFFVSIGVMDYHAQDAKSAKDVGLDSAAAEVTSLKIAGQHYKVSGPHEHQRVSVYFLHAQKKNQVQFITLEEGLASGKVKIRERESASVHRLEIRNRSNRPLFLQEGDRVVGGQQDRIVPTPIVLERDDKFRELKVYCVESGRWSEGTRGREFAKGKNRVMALTKTRISAKYARNQSKVWTSVKDYKQLAKTQMGTKNGNSSLTETMDSRQLRKISLDAMKHFRPLVRNEKDAVGAVFLVDGEFVEMDIYANHALFEQMFLKLVATITADASLKEKADLDSAAYETESNGQARNQTQTQTQPQNTSDSEMVKLAKDGSYTDHEFEEDKKPEPIHWSKQLELISLGDSSFTHEVMKDNQTKLYFHDDGSAMAMSFWKKKPIHIQIMGKVKMGKVKSTNTATDEEEEQLYQRVMDDVANDLPVDLEELKTITKEELKEKYKERVEDQVKQLEELKDKDLDELKDQIKNQDDVEKLIPKIPGM